MHAFAVIGMIGLEVNDAYIVQQKKALERALSTDPKTQKAFQAHIRRTILQVRSEMVKDIKFKNGDPRESARSIRTTVYRKILGANINIYNSRKLHRPTTYEPPRHPSRIGGNRIKVNTNSRSYIRAHYGPLDRGFILRFVNDGTVGRYAGYGRNGRTEAEKVKFIVDNEGRGWRKKITPRNFFKPTGERILVKAIDTLSNMIDNELDSILNYTK